MECLTKKITSFLIVLAMVFSLSAPTSAMEKSSFEKLSLTEKAAVALGISLPFIANYLTYVIDPSEKIASYLDSKDAKPDNGYFGVVN